MSWLADICLAPMIGYFLLVPKRCASPEVLQARRLVVRVLTEICLHASIGRLMRLLFAQSLHPRLLCLCESALSPVGKLERSTRLPKADVRRAGVDT